MMPYSNDVGSNFSVELLTFLFEPDDSVMGKT
jgi:hypothetical protein